jgi:hypothetical protein
MAQAGVSLFAFWIGGASYYSSEEELVVGGRTDEEELQLAIHKWHQRLLASKQTPKTTPPPTPPPHPDISAIASKLGRAGGYARAEALTAKQRSDQASKAAQVRWRK